MYSFAAIGTMLVSGLLRTLGMTVGCYEMQHQNRELALDYGSPVSGPCRKLQDATIRATPHAP